MDFEEVFKALDAAIFAKTQRRLKDVERFVLLGAYLGQTYEEMAKAYDYRYTPSYLKQDVGPKLWKLLSEVLGEAVSKTNFYSAIERQTQLQEIQKPQKTLKLYEAEYGERLKLAGETLYQSCLSPSSHEQPEEVVLLKREKLPVRLWHGLQEADDSYLLRHQGSSITAASTTQVHSPFIAGPPITHPHQFFGRERELNRLFNLWKQLPLQNAALIGPRRSGKTSLLLYLKSITTTPRSQLRPGQRASWLPRPEQYRWIFVDFQDPRLGSREGLLSYLLACLDLPVADSCNLDDFLDLVSRNLRTPTVILLDEIGIALQRYHELDSSFWDSLRSLTNQVEGNLAFVLADSETPTQLANRTSLGCSFFNMFGYTAHLRPLTEEEAHELITSSPIPFSAADLDWLLSQIGRWPLLLQILCRERLIALEVGETDDTWKTEGLAQIKPYRYLLEDS